MHKLTNIEERSIRVNKRKDEVFGNHAIFVLGFSPEYLCT